MALKELLYLVFGWEKDSDYSQLGQHHQVAIMIVMSMWIPFFWMVEVLPNKMVWPLSAFHG